MAQKIKAVVWNEFRHEKKHEAVQKVYPDGIHKVIADLLNEQSDIKATTATLDEPQHGLTDEVLAGADVMLWWATWRTTKSPTKSSTRSSGGSSRVWA